MAHQTIANGHINFWIWRIDCNFFSFSVMTKEVAILALKVTVPVREADLPASLSRMTRCDKELGLVFCKRFCQSLSTIGWSLQFNGILISIFRSVLEPSRFAISFRSCGFRSNVSVIWMTSASVGVRSDPDLFSRSRTAGSGGV